VDPARAFQPTADPASLWLTGQYDDALRMLRSAVLGRQGLLALVGESGTGKTVLAHALATRLRDDTVVVGRLLYPILEGMDVLAAVAEAFGLPVTFTDRDGFVEQFRRFAGDTTVAGRRVLLIVDEAQRLNRELLVELGRLPYADGAGSPASLSVLFVGQRGLLDALRAEAVEPDVLCHLRPLTREQTAQYIAHRLQAVRHRRRFFTPSALRKIWVVSEGIPQVVNDLCVDALGSLGATGRRTVTAAMIDRSPKESDEAPAPETVLAPIDEAPIELPSPPRAARRRPLASLATAACILLVLVGIWAVKRSDRAPAFLAGPAATTASTVQEVPPHAGSEASAARPGISTESTPERSTIGPVAGPTAVPERTEPPTPIASRPRVATPPARKPRVADEADATRVIDWLLEKRSPGGSVPRD
jgi:type II secretory pathway predicted ATPase ExeA